MGWKTHRATKQKLPSSRVGFQQGASTMSKKHFRALADAIANIADKTERERAARLVADVCIGFNGRFDRGRFLRACGVAP